jgi:hypothetical protein
VATGDVTGDGIDDVITAPGTGGGPHVKVFDGATGALVREWMAYDPAFRGGMFVAAGDVTGDGIADVVTGAGTGGGPHVKAFDPRTGAEVRSFMAYGETFRGGVTVAAADVDGDGRADIITGAGPGGGPHVKVFSGADGSVLRSFLAFDAAFRGGVFVAGGRANADANGDIVVGAGTGGGPHVRVFSGADLSELWSFFAYGESFRGGVTVAARDYTGDGVLDIVTGTGSGRPQVKIFNNNTREEVFSTFPYDPAFVGGVFVG